MFLNINNAQILWYIENMSQDEEENFEVQLEMIEYLASFINSEAVKKAREHRRGNRIESTENIEDQMKDRDALFNDPLVRAVGKTLGKVTNKNKNSDMSKFDIHSTLYKTIRD
tara:strand:- start:256 stop:594 length:339 start_codon:yes stop_codon:yes gene_type:complete